MRKGFTLIELLLVVVIIGIVASFVLPKFGDVKAKAYKAALKSDLRNLATAQEIYFDTYATYAVDATPLANLMSFSDNVVVHVPTATADGYTATATHTKLASGNNCSIVIGSGAANKVVCNF